MSSWDAPTGSWDSRREPDESGEPDEQSYQHGESTGEYRTVPGDEGRPRAGRRGLPGYEQAQNHDQGSGYGQEPSYGQQPGYGQRPADEPAFGSGGQGSFGSDPLTAPLAQGPQVSPGSGPNGVVGYDEEPTAAY